MKLVHPSPVGPLRSFGYLLVTTERRGRGYPSEAHAVAVGAARRLRCDARPGVAPQNSLRELRSLRSNNRGESDNEARCARRPQACASRRHRNRPCRVPPAASSTTERRVRCLRRVARCFGKGAGGQPAARLCAAEERRARGPRAQRASSSDSPRLSERSERSSRSEFCGGATRPSTAGNPRAARASSEAPPAARPRLCSLQTSRAQACGTSRMTATGREVTFAAEATSESAK